MTFLNNRKFIYKLFYRFDLSFLVDWIQRQLPSYHLYRALNYRYIFLQWRRGRG